MYSIAITRDTSPSAARHLLPDFPPLPIEKPYTQRLCHPVAAIIGRRTAYPDQKSRHPPAAGQNQLPTPYVVVSSGFRLSPLQWQTRCSAISITAVCPPPSTPYFARTFSPKAAHLAAVSGPPSPAPAPPPPLPHRHRHQHHFPPRYRPPHPRRHCRAARPALTDPFKRSGAITIFIFPCFFPGILP